jgi:hypothetical protein
MAPVIEGRDERLAFPGHSAILRDVHSPEVVLPGISIADAADPQMKGIQRVDRNDPDALGNLRGLDRRQEVPGLSPVLGLIDTDT